MPVLAAQMWTLHARNEVPTSPDNTPKYMGFGGEAIAGTVIGLVAIACFLIWYYSRLTHYREVEMAKKKAARERRDWYASLRPVTNTLSHQYSQLSILRVRSSYPTRPEVLQDGSMSPQQQTSSRGTGEALTVPPRIHVVAGRETVTQDELEIGESFRLSHQTVSTVDTTISMGVAVPVSVPDSTGAVEVDTQKTPRVIRV